MKMCVAIAKLALVNKFSGFCGNPCFNFSHQCNTICSAIVSIVHKVEPYLLFRKICTHTHTCTHTNHILYTSIWYVYLYFMVRNKFPVKTVFDGCVCVNIGEIPDRRHISDFLFYLVPIVCVCVFMLGVNIMYVSSWYVAFTARVT